MKRRKGIANIQTKAYKNCMKAIADVIKAVDALADNTIKISTVLKKKEEEANENKNKVK